MSLFRASGGVLYHLRALRAGREWEAFRREIERWLGEWDTPASRLILIGPSGGYTLPTPWLRKFEQIDAYDLDPLAAPLFRLRHARVRVKFHRADVFGRAGRLTIEPLARILSEHAEAAVLFPNVIGQLLLEYNADEDQWLRFLRDLRITLDGRDWASYHDLFTHEGNEVIDHLTNGDWATGLLRTDFSWPLTTGSLHHVQGIFRRTRDQT